VGAAKGGQSSSPRGCNKALWRHCAEPWSQVWGSQPPQSTGIPRGARTCGEGEAPSTILSVLRNVDNTGKKNVPV